MNHDHFTAPPHVVKAHKLRAAQRHLDRGGDLDFIKRAYGVEPHELLVKR